MVGEERHLHHRQRDHERRHRIQAVDVGHDLHGQLDLSQRRDEHRDEVGVEPTLRGGRIDGHLGPEPGASHGDLVAHHIESPKIHPVTGRLERPGGGDVSEGEGGGTREPHGLHHRRGVDRHHARPVVLVADLERGAQLGLVAEVVVVELHLDEPAEVDRHRWREMGGGSGHEDVIAVTGHPKVVVQLVGTGGSVVGHQYHRGDHGRRYRTESSGIDPPGHRHRCGELGAFRSEVIDAGLGVVCCRRQLRRILVTGQQSDGDTGVGRHRIERHFDGDITVLAHHLEPGGFGGGSRRRSRGRGGGHCGGGGAPSSTRSHHEKQ